MATNERVESKRDEMRRVAGRDNYFGRFKEILYLFEVTQLVSQRASGDVRL